MSYSSRFVAQLQSFLELCETDVNRSVSATHYTYVNVTLIHRWLRGNLMEMRDSSDNTIVL